MVHFTVAAFALACISAILFVRYVQHPEHPTRLRRLACVILALSLLCIIANAGGIKAYKDDRPRIIRQIGCNVAVSVAGEVKSVDLCA